MAKATYLYQITKIQRRKKKADLATEKRLEGRSTKPHEREDHAIARMENIYRPDPYSLESSTYDAILKCREMRILNAGPYGSEKRLEGLVQEIKLRTAVSKLEVFEVGGLLMEVKLIVGHGNFKTFVEDNFEFSYETANNAMRVYRTCLGYRELVRHLPLTTLYDISRLSDEDRVRVFEHAKIDCAPDAVTEFVRRCKKGEISEGQEEAFFMMHRCNEQLRFSLNQYEKAIQTLCDLDRQIEQNSRHKAFLWWTESHPQEPEIDKIRVSLHEGLRNAINDLDKRRIEAVDALYKMEADAVAGALPEKKDVKLP